MENLPVLILYTVLSDEGFEHAASALVEMVYQAQKQFPGEPRILCLDVEGHTNADGFDADMFELQQEFAMGFLLSYLSELHTPLLHAQGVAVHNQKWQNNDVPNEFYVVNSRNEASLLRQIVEMEGKSFAVVEAQEAPAFYSDDQSNRYSES